MSKQQHDLLAASAPGAAEAADASAGSPPSAGFGALDLPPGALRHLIAGETVFQAGDIALHGYLVHSGAVECSTALSPHGRPATRLAKGDLFGIAETLRGGLRRNWARASEDTTLVAVDAAALLDFVEAGGVAAARLVESLAAGIGELQQHLTANQTSAEPEAAAKERAPYPGSQPVDAAPRVPSTPAGPAPRPDGRRTAGEGTPPDASEPLQAAVSTPDAELVWSDARGRFSLPAQGEVVVGRVDPLSGIRPEVDLTDLDPKRSVSRRHARIGCDGKSWRLRGESGASNGTWLNGKRLGANEASPLADGDRLRFGLVEATFRLADGD